MVIKPALVVNNPTLAPLLATPVNMAESPPTKLVVILSAKYVTIELRDGLVAQNKAHGRHLTLGYDFAGNVIVARLKRGSHITLATLMQQCGCQLTQELLESTEIQSI